MSASVAQHVDALRALPIVRIVQEGFGDIRRAEMRRQLRLTLDAAEVEMPFVDQLAHHVVDPDLTL